MTRTIWSDIKRRRSKASSNIKVLEGYIVVVSYLLITFVVSSFILFCTYSDGYFQ